MISPFDDYCIHQAPSYLRVPSTTDRNFYDRYFFSGYRPDGGVIFGVAFGRYPNRFVQDAHFTVSLDGSQHSVHASDALGPDPAECKVGPIQISVEEPMRRLRCRVYPNDTGISCDLVFRAETGAIDEGRLVVGKEGINWIDQTRFMQYGRWTGWIEVDGVRVQFDDREAFGLRDKSWGVRLIGDQHVTQRRGDQIFWMNVVMRLDAGFCVFRTLDRADGSSVEREGYLAPLYETADQVPVGETSLRRADDWQFSLAFRDGTRRISAGSYRVRWRDGGDFHFQGRVVGSLWYAGMGYNHQRWHHGLDHGGGLVVERESWPLHSIDPGDLDRQFIASVMTFTGPDGKIIGFGHTEQLLMGEYVPFQWPAGVYTGLHQIQTTQ